MDAQRKNLVTQYVASLGATTHGPGPTQDVQEYQTAEGQRAYVESYLPKHIGCWRYVRRVLSFPVASTVVSIGAGPRLCLWGWFFDRPPQVGQTILARDILDWQHVRSSESLALEHHILGSSTVQYQAGVYFPEDFVPPQIASVPSIQPLLSSTIPNGSIVLFSFFFSHLLDRSGKITFPQMQQLGARLRSILAAGCTIVIVEKAARDYGTTWFWTDLVVRVLGLTVSGTYPVFDFGTESSEFASCYSNMQAGQYRTQTRNATGLWLTQQKWAWIT